MQRPQPPMHLSPTSRFSILPCGKEIAPDRPAPAGALPARFSVPFRRFPSHSISLAHIPRDKANKEDILWDARISFFRNRPSDSQSSMAATEILVPMKKSSDAIFFPPPSSSRFPGRCEETGRQCNECLCRLIGRSEFASHGAFDSVAFAGECKYAAIGIKSHHFKQIMLRWIIRPQDRCV
jgi:hypothetical protein